MYYLDCPICINSFKFEDIRSLPCGHTYCFSCVDKLIDDTCPECRHDFEVEDVRRLFIKPSASNNSSGSQPASTGCDSRAEEGFIKQAKHIAKRLRKINVSSSAQSVKIAADVIEDVATVQCKEAQEIIWKAVREFWLRLVTDFEQLDRFKDFRERLSDFEQRVRVSEDKYSKLLLEVEIRSDQVQQCMDHLADKTQETERLRMALRDADDEKERQQGLIARLRASEVKHRAQVKQLKKDLKSQEANAVTSKPQLEEESLIIDPGVTYDESRSHRLDVYNEGTRRSKRHKLSPEASSPADGFGFPLSADDCPENGPSRTMPPSPPELHAQLRKGQSSQASLPESDLRQPSPQRPKFGSDWNLSREERPRRKLRTRSNHGTSPFPLDSEGRPKGLLKLGSRVRMKSK